MITLIAAVARNGVIGARNAIPWHLPEDFKHFSTTTRGHAVIMGSNTWWSLPDAYRPLPKRTNIIVTTQDIPDAENTFFVSSIEKALHVARETHGQDEIYIIGGASVYEQTIGQADRLVISEVHMEPEGDTFFPEIGSEWQVSERDEREGFTIVTYVKA